jgi:hypothetical protein
VGTYRNSEQEHLKAQGVRERSYKPSKLDEKNEKVAASMKKKHESLALLTRKRRAYGSRYISSLKNNLSKIIKK